MTATEYVSNEQVILVDKNDQPLGTAEKLFAHQNNLLHRAFSIFIFRRNAENNIEILLQQRAFHKYHSEGLWTNTCCSHPRPGESILDAGKRRLKEELGLVADLVQIGWFHYQADFENGLAENEIDHVLMGEIAANTNYQPNPDEIYTTRWVTISKVEVEYSTNPSRFTPWFQTALGQFKNHLNSI